jgi:hypothetical protein
VAANASGDLTACAAPVHARRLGGPDRGERGRLCRRGHCSRRPASGCSRRRRLGRGGGRSAGPGRQRRSCDYSARALVKTTTTTERRHACPAPGERDRHGGCWRRQGFLYTVLLFGTIECDSQDNSKKSWIFVD